MLFGNDCFVKKNLDKNFGHIYLVQITGKKTSF